MKTCFDTNVLPQKKASAAAKAQSVLNRDKYLIMLVAPVIIYFIIFHYVPMYGVIIAFKDFDVSLGINNSPWVGLQWFSEFFSSVYFGRILKNTVILSAYNLLWGFPIPIIFALILNELKNGLYKKTIQTISYFPYFMSMVIVVGMLVNFVSPRFGIVNQLLNFFGKESVDFMGDPKYFRFLYVASDIWKNFGWNSVIYLAALTGINPDLYEAARVDGAGKWKQLIRITIPGLAPTMVIMLILGVGSIMSVGFEKIILMYNPAVYETADVISTYVYRRGILGAQYSFASAVGLFNSVINLILLFSVNKISKKLGGTSLW